MSDTSKVSLTIARARSLLLEWLIGFLSLDSFSNVTVVYISQLYLLEHIINLHVRSNKSVSSACLSGVHG